MYFSRLYFFLYASGFFDEPEAPIVKVLMTNIKEEAQLSLMFVRLALNLS